MGIKTTLNRKVGYVFYRSIPTGGIFKTVFSSDHTYMKLQLCTNETQNRVYSVDIHTGHVYTFDDSKELILLKVVNKLEVEEI